MDAVMDLAARAVSLITLVQDSFLKSALSDRTPGHAPITLTIYGDDFEKRFRKVIAAVKKYEHGCRIHGIPTASEAGVVEFESKVFDLVWYSREQVPDTDEKKKQLAEDYLVDLCTGLSAWMITNEAALTKQIREARPLLAFPATIAQLVAPPFVWLEALGDVLYRNPAQRVAMAKALEYLPIHVVLALDGGGYDAHEQRVLQWWQAERPYEKMTLTDKENKLHQAFKQQVYRRFGGPPSEPEATGDALEKAIQKTYLQTVAHFLLDYKILTDALLESNAPLSFKYVLGAELAEIEQARLLRRQEPSLVNFPAEITGEVQDNQDASDPLTKAKNMRLNALALSGGGIRSATFNLGIIQGLARIGWLNRVDYLSTVSGGGYIGSWLATWIKRDGSVAKVAERLNPDLSADPMGEEVRPIRWLRMFSNHFAPDKSIMSVDSWTIGITWLRNTLLNQLVIFFILLSALLLLRVIFEAWLDTDFWINPVVNDAVYIVTCILLAGIAFSAGRGMEWYNRNSYTRLPFGNSRFRFSLSLAWMAYAGAFIVSTTLYFHAAPGFKEMMLTLWPAGAVTASLLLLIAFFGRYDKCVTSFGESKSRAVVIVAYTAVLAAVAGCLALAGAWKLITMMRPAWVLTADVIRIRQALCFTFGPPLVLFVLGLTVVTRMALLGKYFPDERREWWGRMGATINRSAFIWILMAATVSLLRDIISSSFAGWQAPATVGGWMALVAGTVKAAFDAKTSGKEESGGLKTTLLSILSKAGPYLFILGLLVFLPALIDPLLERTPFVKEISSLIVRALVLSVLLFVLGLLLSSRLGINEFSMHHFYRNRLVRAYLGATRRKASREKTANPFTNFDKLDDEKLSKFTHKQGYYGPYPVLNTALNTSQASDTSRQDRKAESFIFSPLFCGFDFSKVRSSINTLNKTYDYGFRPTKYFAYSNDNGPAIGTAMAISGAAVNPNQGYHSSPGTAFLLTVFNVQMGWWIGNTRKNKWTRAEPDEGLGYLIHSLTGNTSTKSEFVNLSDGGHFDNMGLYEMVRRRCTFIILGDAEQDENFTCEGLANAIRRCRIDFGAEINIDIDAIVSRKDNFSKQHFALGDISYSGEAEPSGKLLYIKTTVTGDEPVDVAEYALKNKSFPHQTTADQFFDEEQFESYRKLGLHIVEEAFSDERVVQALTGGNAKTTQDGKKPNGIAEHLRFYATVKNFFLKD